MDTVLLVITNVPDQDAAKMVAGHILQKKLAACVNIMPEMQSLYTWNGRQEAAAESALFIKTTQACYQELQALILQVHPYELPEIIAIPVADGLPAYLQWVRTETGSQ